MDEFTRLPIAEVADIISGSNDFKPNCAVVIIDFLVRDNACAALLAPHSHRHRLHVGTHKNPRLCKAPHA